MKRYVFIPYVLITAIMLLMTACSGSSVPPSSGGEERRGNVERGTDVSYKVLAEHLETPWAIDFHGEVIFLSEREGNIVQIRDGDLSRLPVVTSKPIASIGEGGLLGFVFAPDYEESNAAYAYHTYEQDGAVKNRLVLLQENAAAWKETDALIEDIPGSNVHNGGRIEIGPDGFLYITTGDAGNGELAQDPESLAGKILRISLDGSVPADNPIPDSYVYSFGHLNAQGLDWNSDGELYSSEHGPSGTPGGHDEINKIAAGANYGWPAMIGDARESGMEQPVYHTGETALAPSGVAFDKQDLLYVATLRGSKLYRFDPDKAELETVLAGEGRLRDVKVQDGRIYVITNNTDGRGVPGERDDRLLVLEL